MYDDLPWWLLPISLLVIASFGIGPVLVFIWGLKTSFTHLRNFVDWLLWLYFGPIGGIAFVIDRIRYQLSFPR